LILLYCYLDLAVAISFADDFLVFVYVTSVCVDISSIFYAFLCYFRHI